MEEVKNYFEQHRSSHLSQLKEFLSIPSISADPDHKPDMGAAASWVEGSMQAAGLENTAVMETGGHPVVYGDWMHAPGKPTVLFYGHYDVQPADPVELWETPPFQPDIRDEKIYARGATDDKGQVFMHLKTIEAFMQTKRELPVNVKFCIEGEEEIGSPNLDEFVEKHRELLQGDVLLVSDTPMLEKGRPTVCYGLRGLAGIQIDVNGAKGDLHSGLYGGGVANPLHALADILASMHDDSGRITVDGFYDRVLSLTDQERRAYAELSYDEESTRKELNVPELFGEEGFSFLERTWARPTLEINGMHGGFQGEGIKTVLPSAASAKITCRLVPDQDPDEIVEKLTAHVQQKTPKGVVVNVTPFDKGRPFVTPFDHPAIQAAGRALETAYGTTAAYTRMGGSVPVIETFSQILNVPVALMGFGLPTENFHAPNEHFHLENYDKGLEALAEYLMEISENL
ncbi:Acetylornithine deacetylase/Succinyl-diaminopimelate desuccinylase [Marinococcus luteus]|uniref:Acetylornithine deacetylase/Succinyl-diaminopimelate desuccinylase n=1 Tax=Marinococcus luteus TaxID=1122204 RepID=A0A1H2XB27_9BACI|nr:dipeptidase [Marinococcus luteus]SDW89469.1 Acetylornithine deacetylase/Succinyl-diaminopimelate desuccinylase [Marinococcus luteus]